MREKSTDLSFLTPERMVSRILNPVKKNQAILGADAWIILVIQWLFPRQFLKILKTLQLG